MLAARRAHSEGAVDGEPEASGILGTAVGGGMGLGVDLSDSSGGSSPVGSPGGSGNALALEQHAFVRMLRSDEELLRAADAATRAHVRLPDSEPVRGEGLVGVAMELVVAEAAPAGGGEDGVTALGEAATPSQRSHLSIEDS